ncbi:MAG: PCMD domain-containing protein [Bacteroidales bacterium]|nr:PCMD domain-containing protein [Bacteroidales bacterium]
MKNQWVLIILLFTCITEGCIKEEAANSEADIIECTLTGNVLNRLAEIGNDSITLTVKEGTDLTKLAPLLKLTPGATVEPISGMVQDFSKVQYYIVTSEDRQWSKRYAIRVVSSGITTTEDIIKFDFEFWKKKNIGTNYYPVFYETGDQGEILFDWASGNAGFALTGMATEMEEYPTHWSPEGHSGGCVELITRSTGSFGAMAQKPLAAGNMFLGTFDFSKALSTPLYATLFGIQFEYEPISLSGWMDYQPGDVFYTFDKTSSTGLKPMPGQSDQCAIYAALYEVSEDVPYLTGADAPIKENPHVVCYAEIDESLQKGTHGWTYFEIPFKTLDGRTLDYEKLQEGRYNLTVVFSSSTNGATFEGAVGSRLKVDDIKITINKIH